MKTASINNISIKKLKLHFFIIAVIFFLKPNTSSGQGMIISQCAIDVVKGLDSLVKNQLVTSCHPWIKQHRTILQSNCSVLPCGAYPTSGLQRRVYMYTHKFTPSTFRLHWHFRGGVVSHFGYYGLCTPTDTTQFPQCSTVVNNHVDEIRVKKIVGSTLVNENVHNITEIKNPRLANPLSPFWAFVSPNLTTFNSLTWSMGVLVDVSVGTNTFVAMLEHTYPNGYIKWKENIACPTVNNVSITQLVSSGSCSKIQLNATINNGAGPCGNVYWNFGDGSPLGFVSCPSGAISTVYTYSTPGSYTASAIVAGPGSCYTEIKTPLTVTCTIPCVDCIPSFAPEAGKEYIISGWVKENNPPQSTTSYSNPKISIQYTPAATPPVFSPSGQIIDGWQRVEGQFLIPSGTTNIGIKLDCLTADCFYDDIRVFPVDGSMKSYVYDPVNMRLVAELDERNYATLYEYDEEGKLIRIKKETEKGKMTIQENRNNTKKP